MSKFFSSGLFALTVFLATSARAEIVDFSYVWATNNVVSGTMDGTLLGDGNKFDVSSIASLFVNGVSVPTPTFIIGTDAFSIPGSPPAAVTLDGSFMDLYVRNAPGAGDIMLFAVGDQTAADLGANVVAANLGYGGSGNVETYVRGNWTASLEGATVPEPSSLLLMLGSLALLSVTWGLRRRPV